MSAYTPQSLQSLRSTITAWRNHAHACGVRDASLSRHYWVEERAYQRALDVLDRMLAEAEAAKEKAAMDKLQGWLNDQGVVL